MILLAIPGLSLLVWILLRRRGEAVVAWVCLAFGLFLAFLMAIAVGGA